MEAKDIFDISWNSFWRLFFFIAFGWLLYVTSDVVLAILVAIVIAAGFDMPVTWLAKKGVPRVIGALILFLVGLVTIAGLVYAIVPLALNDFTHLFANLKDYSNPLIDALQASDALSNITAKLNDWADALISGAIPLAQVLGGLFGNVFLLITVFILSFYLTVGQDGVENFLVSILPASQEEVAVDLYLKTRRKIGQWLKGQVLLSMIVGLVVFIGFWILGIKYSLLVGILAAVCEIIPFVGPIFSGVIGVLIALSSSVNLAVSAAILFVFVQQLENHLLVPIVMRYTTSLDPTVVLIAILVGGKAFGFLGLILAIPVAVLIQSIVERWTSAKKKKKGLGL